MIDTRLIFDAHTHLDDKLYKAQKWTKKIMLGQALENKVGYLCDVGCSYQTTKQCIKNATKFSNVYATVGIHPNEVVNHSLKQLKKLAILAKKPKVVAIGEVGLDYYYSDENKVDQKIFFQTQIELAIANDLTLMMHIRDKKNVYQAYDDVIEILQAYDIPRMIVHCFSANREYAQKFLSLGCYINIGGAVTFKNAKELQEVVKILPIERILVETDAPYLTPHPFRGKINAPKNIIYTVEKIGQLKNLPIEEVIKQTTNNAFEIFNLEKNED